MKYNRLISLLVLCIAILSIFASAIGIFSNAEGAAYEIESFRGETIELGYEFSDHMPVVFEDFKVVYQI